MKAIAIFSSVFFLFLITCSRPKEQKSTKLFSPRVIEAKGYLVPKDSLAEPQVVLAGKPVVIKSGKPELVLTNTNIIPAGMPKVVVAGTPKIYNSGQDGFPLFHQSFSQREIIALTFPVKDTQMQELLALDSVYIINVDEKNCCASRSEKVIISADRSQKSEIGGQQKPET